MIIMESPEMNIKMKGEREKQKSNLKVMSTTI